MDRGYVVIGGGSEVDIWGSIWVGETTRSRGAICLVVHKCSLCRSAVGFKERLEPQPGNGQRRHIDGWVGDRPSAGTSSNNIGSQSSEDPPTPQINLPISWIIERL